MKTLILLLSSVLCLASFGLASGDVVQVGDFQYVVLTKADYEKMAVTMDAIKQRLDNMHSNETGRVALHGERKHTVQSNGVMSVEYADGWTRKVQMRRVKRTDMMRQAAKKGEAQNLPNIPERLRKARQKRAEAAAKTNVVNVTFGGGAK